jgi:hypothetical protein
VKLDPEAFREFLSDYRGTLLSLSGKSVRRFDDIDESEAYRIDSAFYKTQNYRKRRSQVDDDVLELEVGLAVEREINAKHPGSAQLHQNVKFPGVEFDGVVVHVGKEDQDSDAYVIECGYRPGIEKVQSLTDKVKNLSAYHKNVPHFTRVKNIIPVFGARKFDDSVLKYCVENKIWHVKPNGLGYQVVRYFSQMVKKLI